MKLSRERAISLINECRDLDALTRQIVDILHRRLFCFPIDWDGLAHLIGVLKPIYIRQLELITIFANSSCIPYFDNLEHGIKAGENMTPSFVEMLQEQNQSIRTIEILFTDGLRTACENIGASKDEMEFWTNHQLLDYIKEHTLTKTTTKEHFEKYAILSASVPTWIAPKRENLRELFQQDPNLNNIPLEEFDDKYDAVISHIAQASKSIQLNVSLAESCCVLKHILIYRILGVKPIFEEEKQCKKA